MAWQTHPRVAIRTESNAGCRAAEPSMSRPVKEPRSIRNAGIPYPEEVDMAKPSKPDIVFIMSDDIGWFNVSCYNHGIMG
jgi:hypothetical protein